MYDTSESNVFACRLVFSCCWMMEKPHYSNLCTSVVVSRFLIVCANVTFRSTQCLSAVFTTLLGLAFSSDRHVFFCLEKVLIHKRIDGKYNKWVSVSIWGLFVGSKLCVYWSFLVLFNASWCFTVHVVGEWKRMMKGSLEKTSVSLVPSVFCLGYW